MDEQEVLAKLNAMTKGTLMETLEIVYTSIGDHYLEATMPVNSRVHQPMGLLHGGATAALAESVGSAASFVFANNPSLDVRGIEISANHLRSKREGIVKAKAKCTHRGRTMHFWQIDVVDETDRLISVCKLTCMVLTKKDKNGDA